MSGALLASEDNDPEQAELVDINFPEPTDIKVIAIVLADLVSKNVLLDCSRIRGRVQILARDKVTKKRLLLYFPLSKVPV